MTLVPAVLLKPLFEGIDNNVIRQSAEPFTLNKTLATQQAPFPYIVP